MAYLLISLGREGRDGSSGHGGVRNGGLWWLKLMSEDAQVGLLSSGLSPFLCLSCCWDVWHGVEATEGDEVVQGGWS